MLETIYNYSMFTYRPVKRVVMSEVKAVPGFPDATGIVSDISMPNNHQLDTLSIPPTLS